MADNQMETKKRNKKITWTKESTEALLDFYAAREREFQHSRKKKQGYDHLLLDMVSAGYADENTTSAHLEIKIQTLLRAYKTAVDNNKQTGAAPCVAPFMKKMEDLFGKKSMISHTNGVSLGVATIGNPSVSPLADVNDEVLGQDLPTSSQPSLPDSSPPTPSTEPLASTSSGGERKKRMTKGVYLENKIKMRMNETKEKDKKWKEFMDLQKEKQETRKRKSDLLEEYLRNKK